MKIKEIYDKLIFTNKFLKIARFIHFSKTSPFQLNIKDDDKCLLLSPHPDDETMGCAGLLCKYSKNFEIICLTDGRHGGYDNKENLVETRKNEFINAMNLLNIEQYSFLNIEDRKLIYNFETFKNIDLSKYNYVFIPNYLDQHKDHKAVTVLLQKMIKSYKNKHLLNFKIAFYEVWSPLAVFNYFINISAIIETKRKLINIYKSQTKLVNFEEGITGLNIYRGMLCNCKIAEVFSILDIKDFMKL